MRIWDISAERLCRSHLLGEHGELHAIWSILTKNKKGYLHHPEVLRWMGHLKALISGMDDLSQKWAEGDTGIKQPPRYQPGQRRREAEVFC